MKVKNIYDKFSILMFSLFLLLSFFFDFIFLFFPLYFLPHKNYPSDRNHPLILTL